MVWEKGRPAATIYVLEVQRRDARLDGTLDSVSAYQQAREAALASQPEKAVVSDRSVVNVRSHTVQVEVKVVEFNRSVLKQAGLNIFSTRANSGARCKESLQSAVDIDDALKVDCAPMLEPICAYQTREELALCRELSTRVP